MALSLRLRVPYWATRGIAVRLNGEKQDASAKPSSYWTIERTWRTGDRLEVSLPMSVHAHPMPDDPTVQAFMYGPLVLAGALGNEGLTYEMMYADPVNARRGEGMRGQPVPAPDLVAPSPIPETGSGRSAIPRWIGATSRSWPEARATGRERPRTAGSPSASPGKPAPCRWFR